MTVPMDRPFDERLTTKLTRDIDRHRRTRTLHTVPLDASTPASTASVASAASRTAEPALIRWLKLPQLSNMLYSDSFRLQYGEPSLIRLSPLLLCVGTVKGFVLVFDYAQTVREIIGGSQSAMHGCGTITSVAILVDSTHVVCGSVLGGVFLWRLGHPGAPVVHIQPVSALERRNGRTGHLRETPIVQLDFVSHRNTLFVLADALGMVFTHSGTRGLLGHRFAARRILGLYENPVPATILGCQVLPLGTAVEPTDSMGLTAVMSGNVLAVVSLTETDPKLSEVTMHYKVGKPQDCLETPVPLGCLAWYPAVARVEGRSCAKLVYCWSNVLTVVGLESSIVAVSNRMADPIPTLKFTRVKRYRSLEAFLEVQWINHNLLAALTVTQQMLLIHVNESTLDVLPRDLSQSDLLDRHVLSSLHRSACFQISKERMLLLGKRELFVGVLTTWVDVLMAMVVSGEYVAALAQACLYYKGTHNSPFIGLPDTPKQRQAAVRLYLVELVKVAIDATFSPAASSLGVEETAEESQADFSRGDSTRVCALLKACFEVCATIEASTEVLETLFEVCTTGSFQSEFFDVLEGFIYSSKIIALSPSILQSMVERYLAGGKGHALEELLCFLDMDALDIDLTVQLCRQHGLKDTLVYIWNVSLGDYISPLMDFIRELTPLPHCPPGESHRVFSYLSYILTGRQYPTDKPVMFSQALRARFNVYHVLFSGIPCIWPPGAAKVHILVDHHGEPAYPYLWLLLKYSARDLLRALNEAFEDSILNDEEASLYQPYQTKLTRQQVVDILLDVFEAGQFDRLAHLYLAIFLTRNYAKFTQFISLLDAVLEEAIETLCSCDGSLVLLRNDCELGLQSLLSVYTPPHLALLVPVFEAAGFERVLVDVYRAQGHYAKLLRLYLADGGSVLLAQAKADIISMCLCQTASGTKERREVVRSLNQAFVKVADPPSTMVKIFDTYEPLLHHSLFDLSEDLQYAYLTEMFALEKKGTLRGVLTAKEREAYLKSLCLNDRLRVLLFASNLGVGTVDLDHVVPVLRSAGCMDALVSVLVNHGAEPRAFQELTGYFEGLDPQTVVAHEARANLELLMGLCSTDDQWLTLLGLMVGLLATTRVLTETQKRHEKAAPLALEGVETPLGVPPSPAEEAWRGAWEALSKELAQTALRRLVAHKGQGSLPLEGKASIMRIFSSLLGDTAKDTALGDVRVLLQEVSLSYVFEREMMGLTLKTLSDHIIKDMRRLDVEKVRGWMVERLCAACGKAVWGKGISNANHVAWEDRVLHRVHVTTGKASRYAVREFSKDNYTECVLVVFKCLHGYHFNCLTSLGESDKCLVCR